MAEHGELEATPPGRLASRKCCFVFTWRQGAILNGLLQSTFHLILSTLMIVTLKITLLMREKQIADLRDHGANNDQILHGDHSPETTDLMRLWNAKVHNDVKINLTSFCLFFNTFYALSCTISVYGAMVRSRRLILLTGVSCFVALIALASILFFGSYIYTGNYTLLIKEGGISVMEKYYGFQTTIAWSILLGMAFYSILVGTGHYATLRYYFELARPASVVTVVVDDATGTVKPINFQELTSHGKNFMKILWPTESIKTILHSLKMTHAKFQSSKPTAV